MSFTCEFDYHLFPPPQEVRNWVMKTKKQQSWNSEVWIIIDCTKHNLQEKKKEKKEGRNERNDYNRSLDTHPHMIIATVELLLLQSIFQGQSILKNKDLINNNMYKTWSICITQLWFLMIANYCMNHVPGV